MDIIRKRIIVLFAFVILFFSSCTNNYDSNKQNSSRINNGEEEMLQEKDEKEMVVSESVNDYQKWLTGTYEKILTFKGNPFLITASYSKTDDEGIFITYSANFNESEKNIFSKMILDDNILLSNDVLKSDCFSEGSFDIYVYDESGCEKKFTFPLKVIPNDTVYFTFTEELQYLTDNGELYSAHLSYCGNISNDSYSMLRDIFETHLDKYIL